MAITIKHDAAGLVGAYAAGQKSSNRKALKYGQELLANQQKYAFEAAENQQNRLVDQQRRIEDQTLAATKDAKATERQTMLDNRQAEADKRLQERQAADDSRRSFNDRQGIQGQLYEMPIPELASPEDKQKLGKLKSELDDLLNASKFDLTDPNNQQMVTRLMGEYRSIRDGVVGRLTSEQDAAKAEQKRMQDEEENKKRQQADADRAQKIQADKAAAYRDRLAKLQAESVGGGKFSKTVVVDGEEKQVFDYDAADAEIKEEFTRAEAYANPGSIIPAQPVQTGSMSVLEQPSLAPPAQQQSILEQPQAPALNTQPQPVVPSADGRPATIAQPANTVFGTGSMSGPITTGGAYPGSQPTKPSPWAEVVQPPLATQQPSLQATSPPSGPVGYQAQNMTPVSPTPSNPTPPVANRNWQNQSQPQPTPAVMVPPSQETQRQKNVETTTQTAPPMSVAPGRSLNSGLPLGSAPTQVSPSEPGLAVPDWNALGGGKSKESILLQGLYEKNNVQVKDAITALTRPGDKMQAVEILMSHGIDIEKELEKLNPKPKTKKKNNLLDRQVNIK